MLHEVLRLFLQYLLPLPCKDCIFVVIAEYLVQPARFVWLINLVSLISSIIIIIIIYSHQSVQTISISSSISCDDSKEQLKLPSLMNNSSSKTKQIT